MKILPTIILSTVIVCISIQAQASVDPYLKKHMGISASKAQQERIAQYDNLIEYFTALPYFSNGIEIHPDFVRALILAESNGYPMAVSKKNARGLCQILPSTGKDAAKAILANPAIDVEQLEYVHRTQLEQLTSQDLHDPAVNIMLACYLISKYNHDYQGALDLVISAWNAGAGSINYGQPPEYTETLNMIGKVNGLFLFSLN